MKQKKMAVIIITIIIVAAGIFGYISYSHKSEVDNFNTYLEEYKKDTSSYMLGEYEEKYNSLIKESTEIVNNSEYDKINDIKIKLSELKGAIENNNKKIVTSEIEVLKDLDVKDLDIKDKKIIEDKINEIETLNGKSDYKKANDEFTKLKSEIEKGIKSVKEEKAKQQEIAKQKEIAKKQAIEDKKNSNDNISYKEFVRLSFKSDSRPLSNTEIQDQVEFQNKIKEYATKNNRSIINEFQIGGHNPENKHEEFLEPINLNNNEVSPSYYIGDMPIYIYRRLSGGSKSAVDREGKLYHDTDIINAFKEGKLYEVQNGEKIKAEYKPQLGVTFV